MKKYKKVFVFAFIVGILSILPYVITYVRVNTPGPQTLHYFYQDSELVYLARIREILEGQFRVSTPFFLEYKEAQNIQQPFGELVYVFFTFGAVSLVPLVGFLSKFVLPALLFFLVFLLSQKLISCIRDHETTRTDEAIAIFAASFAVLGLEFNHLGFWIQVFGSGEHILQLSLWTRLVNPITGALGLFLLAYLLFRIDERPTPWKIIVAGMLLACMSGYIFSFSYGLIMVGGMLCFAILEKRWMYMRALLGILTITLIVNCFYFYGMFFGEADMAVLKKSGLLLTHSVLHNKILYVGGIALFFYTYMRTRWGGEEIREIIRNRFWQWSFVMIGGGIFILNQQVITGQTVWPGHYVQYTNPVVYIIGVLLVYKSVGLFVQRRYSTKILMYEKWVQRLSYMGVAFIFAINAYIVIPAFTEQAIYVDSQRYTLPLTYLNENAPTPCVVFVFEADERLEKYIPAYTQCDLYHSAYTFHAIPQERILHNYIVYLRMVGVSEEKVSEYLDAHEADIHRFFFEDWVDIFPNNGDTWLLSTKPKEEQAAFLVKYKALIAEKYRDSFDIPFDTLLKKYHINYILYDLNHELPSEVVEKYPETFRGGNLVIRKVE